MGESAKWKKIGESNLSPTEKKDRAEVKLKVQKKENILVIGSEHSYNSFWLKMMFIAASVTEIRCGLSKVDRTIVAYVPDGYTKLELGVIELWCNNYGLIPKAITSTSALLELLKTDRDEYKIKDLFFFCHGIPGELSVNYKGSVKVALNKANIKSIPSKVFSVDGSICSYACRTGVSSLLESFDSAEDAGSEDSLAQKMADHFKISVYAFMTRSFYGHIIRNKPDSNAISSRLKELRTNLGSNVVHKLSAEHEALPHPGLADAFYNRSAKDEGTNGYSLWRNKGGIGLPYSFITPKGLPHGLIEFKPKES